MVIASLFPPSCTNKLGNEERLQLPAKRNKQRHRPLHVSIRVCPLNGKEKNRKVAGYAAAVVVVVVLTTIGVLG